MTFTEHYKFVDNKKTKRLSFMCSTCCIVLTPGVYLGPVLIVNFIVDSLPNQKTPS